VLLLVDATNPRSPVMTSYPVPAAVTGMAVAGNVLHVSAGAAGYAAYQIPGATPVHYGLTGSCGGPVSWTLNPSSTGTLSTSGLYTAPASLAGSTAVTVTAASQSDPTQTASATVTLSQVLTLSLAPAAPGPTSPATPALSWPP
jgi:hypothetical protein